MNKAKKRKHDTMENPEESESASNILYCGLCKVELPNNSSLKQHLLGQKHKKLYVTQEEQKSIEKKCGIFVKGFPHSMPRDVILDYFLKYGKIVWVHFGDSFVLLDFAEPSSTQEVMNQSHCVESRHLTIKYRQPRQVQRSKEEDFFDVIASLKNSSTFDDQVYTLIQNLQPRAQWQFPRYQQICTDLYNVLFPAFPYCQIHPFGSTITGLNFANSDVDVFISGIKNQEDDVPYLYKTKMLLLNSQIFSKLIVIRNAKIPILRCVHIRTGISCDINIKNMLGVCNSHLINYFLTINPKVKLLMMLLKYWAKVHKISGQSHLFSNYSLTMMLIFFLQQEPYNIPSVLVLQQNPHFFNFHGGWNGGFQPIPFYSPSLNNTPLIKLLGAFFNFYLEFEYGINIICPYLGRSIKKDLFLTPHLLPDYFCIYKKYVNFGTPLKVDSCICMQDPFEHSRNTTPIISASNLNIFVSFCRLGKKICEIKDTDLLYKLFKETPQNLKSEVIVNSESSQFFIPMQPSLKYIENKYEILSERQKAWFDSIVKFTLTVLQDFLKFEINEQDAAASKNKNRKLEGQADVYEKDKIDEKCYDCLAKINLWQGRKALTKNNTSEEGANTSTIIEKEIALTNELCNTFKDLPQTTDIINFETTFQFNVDPPGVVIKIKKITAYKNSFKSFAYFLSANLPSWFNVYEKEQNCSS